MAHAAIKWAHEPMQLLYRLQYKITEDVWDDEYSYIVHDG